MNENTPGAAPGVKVAGRGAIDVKRLFDITLAASLLLILWPVILAVSVAITLTSGNPVLFRQPRAGRHGAEFDLVKFRTMRPSTSNEQEFATDAARVTGLGGFLRRTSLDELPTLVNVLRGDMSLVGPRPLLPEYSEIYSVRHLRRLEVRPGVTGLAQVSGRQHLKFSERFELDIQYVDARTFRGDLEILARTLLEVIGRRGVETGQSFEDVDDVGVREALGIVGGASESKAGSANGD